MSSDHETSKLEALLEAAVDAIITIDDQAIIQSVNRATRDMFGYTEAELLGRNIKFLMPDPWQSKHDGYMSRYLKTGQKKIIGMGREVQGLRKNGSTFHMHLSVSEFEVDGQRFFSGIIHNLTLRKQAEEALQQSQKMEAVGKLTGGIAHDFNNILTIITGNLELLKMHLSDQQHLELLQEAEEAADLGADLTSRLLAFARKSVLEPQDVDLNALIGGMEGMLRRSLGGNFKLKSSLQDDLWDARIDPGQLESALLNLAVNARDAMNDGGELLIETENVSVDDEYAAAETKLAPGNYVRISVIDTGSGMAADVAERVFEPFFTTKAVGQGTGLGLSMVYGFVKQSGGHATIYSEPKIGTTVNLYLPRSDAADEGQIVTEMTTPSNLNGDGETILVVEDDDRVRRLTKLRLEALNYVVLEAESGEAAMDIVKAGAILDLVFTDLVMPGISGHVLASKVLDLNPDLPVILTSGYAEDLVHSDKLSRTGIKLLRKPYRQSDLAELFNKVLSEKA